MLDNKKNIIFFLLFFLVIGLFAIRVFIFSVPKDFPTNSLFRVDKGQHLKEIANMLEKDGLIKNGNSFAILAKMLGREKEMKFGVYSFERPISVWDIIDRITGGYFGVRPVRVTIPEGATVNKISKIISGSLNSFDVAVFKKITEGKEGYLFPDTYFFLPNAMAEDIFRVMENNFNEKIKDLDPEISESGYSKEDIIIMASIIEREVSNSDDKKVVSSVLWNRINIGMPLQVDASFAYLLGKGSSELSLDDLKFESPYNTYTNKGLPPGPISNPGLDSIKAAIHPADTDYLYFLSDQYGKTHFSETFEEHKVNKKKYLR